MARKKKTTKKKARKLSIVKKDDAKGKATKKKATKKDRTPKPVLDKHGNEALLDQNGNVLSPQQCFNIVYGMAEQATGFNGIDHKNKDNARDYLMRYFEHFEG